MKPTLRKAVSFINKHGALLVFPIKNRSEPLSLWDLFYPGDEMVWEWSEDGDDRVARLWHLREELSRSGEVVYAKWHQGRATFFSFELFTALVSYASTHPDPLKGADSDARKLLSVLNEDSPLATKVLKLEAGYEGKEREAAFNRGMKQLWSRLLIVGYGEIEEGGFPSLAVGATRLLFEELWLESQALGAVEKARIVEKFLLPSSPFYRTYRRMERLFVPGSSSSLN